MRFTLRLVDSGVGERGRVGKMERGGTNAFPTNPTKSNKMHKNLSKRNKINPTKNQWEPNNFAEYPRKNKSTLIRGNFH